MNTITSPSSAPHAPSPRSRDSLLVLVARYPRIRELRIGQEVDEHPVVREQVDRIIDGLTAAERDIVSSITDAELQSFLDALDSRLAGIFPAGI